MKKLLALVAFFYSSFAAASPLASMVTSQELDKLIATKVAVIVDANSKETYDKGHIPGAISYSKNEKNFISMLPADKSTLIVAYCGNPKCTAWEFPAKAAQKAGYTNIKHYEPGIQGWVKEGKKVETAKKS